MRTWLREFLDCDRNSGLKTLLWCIMVLGPLSCIWSMVTSISFYVNYFPDSKIATSSWMWHIASLLLLLWMPLSYVITQYWRKKFYLSILFISGCLATITLAIIAICNVADYFEPDFAMEEYLAELKKVVLAKSNLPIWAIKQECCGWNGPRDFGIDNFVGDENFIKAVASCYNQRDALAELIGEPDKLNIVNNLENSAKKGCGRMLEGWINEQREVICACCGLIILPYATSTMTVYLFNYWKFVKSVKYPKSHISLVSIPATSLVFAQGKNGGGEFFNPNPAMKLYNTEQNEEDVADTEQSTLKMTESN